MLYHVVKVSRCILCIIIIIFSSTWKFSYADNLPEDNQALEQRNNISIAGYITKVSIFLVMLVIISFLCMKYIKNNNFGKFSKVSHIKLISSLSLGAKEKIIIINIHNDYFLIGVSSENINLISKLDSSFSTLVAGKNELNLPKLNFLDYFRQYKSQKSSDL